MTKDELKKLQLTIIKKNKKINRIMTIIFLFFASITFILMLLSLTTPSLKEYFIFSIILLIFEVIISLIITTAVKIGFLGDDTRKFKKEFKDIFILDALNKNFENVEYNPDKGIDEKIIENNGMMYLGDRYTSNDYVSGTYKNINFIQSDVHIEEKKKVEDSDGEIKEEWETIFLGRWMIFDFNKNFKANIFVSDYYPFLQNKGYKEISLEDEEFNKLFNVYAEDEHEAYYVLTPHFMEKLKKLKKELNCGVLFYFVESKLHVAVNNFKDSFEPNLSKIINEEEIENNITKDIKLITDLVVDLNLENDLFKME